ncbi:MAG: ROK family protein [Anaerolineae bacterium]
MVTTVNQYIVGVDFGSTNLKAGVCDTDGRLLSFVRQPTHAREGASSVVGRIADVVVKAIEESDQPGEEIAGVVIGACGLVNRQTGYFVSSSVMPTWREVPLAESVSRAVELPVILDNDANAAIFGEWWTGVARGMHNVVGMTLGTGIGGGAILNGRLFHGSSDNAAEFGHMTVDPDGPRCFCGNRGCLGLLAGAAGMVQRCAEQIRQGRSSILAVQVNGERVTLTAQAVYEAAVAGDDLADKIVAQTGKYLGIGTANLLNCFNPDMVVFTGGMTRMGKRLLSIIREEARKRTYPPIYEAAQIEFGQLGDEAGVVGAAGIWNQLRK